MSAGMEVVFHCATMAPSAENATSKALAYAVNVRGTENVIQACQAEGVPKLVYTSSASVVFDGRDLNDVDETAPYAAKPLDYYTQTKVGTSSLAQVLLWRPLHIRGQTIASQGWPRRWSVGSVDRGGKGETNTGPPPPYLVVHFARLFVTAQYLLNSAQEAKNLISTIAYLLLQYR
jgi:hypothetical protein